MEMDEEEAKRTDTVRRVRSLLLLASKKGKSLHDPKDREKKEAEFFKKMFLVCDTNHDGSLNLQEVMGMARKHLKIGERLVSDKQIRDFFNAVDCDGDRQIQFTEFLSFIRMKDSNSKVTDIILTQVKRVVRLAMQRKKMTIADLEHRFAHAKEEGIIEGFVDKSALGPEEMRRFFRKVLEVGTHEAPDRNLVIAFKAMDQDGGGTLDAEEFMDFLKQVMLEETTLCPHFIKDPDRGTTGLLSGMRGALPVRLPRARPGTTFNGGISAGPFCINGRDLDASARLCMSMPALIQSPNRLSHNPQTSMLLPSGLPKSGSMDPSSPKRSNLFSLTSSSLSLTLLEEARSPKGSHDGGSISLPPLSPSVSKSAANAASDGGGERGLYSPVKGMLCKRDADMLNRIESRLFEAGVDVRGTYHKADHKHG
mmetsp:Transcript_74241/g.193310  ORF Transcript_74241/g.193310 Transcript_74241/m.193310 type:complete len:424 (+) Transcript_74241:130-1401(+)